MLKTIEGKAKAMRVLNITADFDDVFEVGKTSAVPDLLNRSRHKHYIVSLNRTSNIFSARSISQGEILSIKYFSPPAGILLRYFILRNINSILTWLRLEKIEVDLIYAHKFSIEGILAYELSRLLNIPYCLGLWGNTDRKIVTYKPNYLAYYKAIFAEAACVLAASPWIESYMLKKLNSDRRDCVLLPIICENLIECNQENPNGPEAQFRLVTALRLDLYREKGLPVLLKSLSRLPNDFALDVYGSGNDKNIEIIKSIINRFNLERRVFLKGSYDRSVVSKVFSNYDCFVMPSHNETFGMVYIEALFSGLPIVYSRGTGVDGYFDDYNVGLKVRSNRTRSLLNSILSIRKNKEFHISEIQRMRNDGGFDLFKVSNVVRRFDDVISGVKC